MSIEYLYNELRENNVKDRTRNDLLANLYKIPRRERGDDMPKFQTLMPNTIQQADLVFLPHDHGYGFTNEMSTQDMARPQDIECRGLLNDSIKPLGIY